jgi:hypothetical protein
MNQYTGTRIDNKQLIHGSLLVANDLLEGRYYICEKTTFAKYGDGGMQFGNFIEVIPESVKLKINSKNSLKYTIKGIRWKMRK